VEFNFYFTDADVPSPSKSTRLILSASKTNQSEAPRVFETRSDPFRAPLNLQRETKSSTMRNVKCDLAKENREVSLKIEFFGGKKWNPDFRSRK
jgi:hypothetical protein